MGSLRKLGSVLRGNLTRTQVFLAGFLGFLLGFVPGFVLPGHLGGGFLQAPGLILTLLFLVLVLNCNLTVFGITLALAKLLSLPLMGVSFAAGRLLLDGPTSPLFGAMINAPVLAWFGLQYYATSGGLLIGLVLGTVWGLALCRGLAWLRLAMTHAEESATFQKHGKRWTPRLVTWALLGRKKSDLSYRQMYEQRKLGLPVRVSGIVVVVILGAGLWGLQSFLGSVTLRDALRTGLERANGATVDLDEVTLDLAGGRATIGGLAMADANALTRDLFRADKLEMSLGTAALLRRRLEIQNITSVAARAGVTRKTPGQRIVKPSIPETPPPTDTREKSLEDYVEDAKAWKERLEQASRWLETLFASRKKETREERTRRIQREVEEHGEARVAATHLVEAVPLLVVRNLAFEDVAVGDSNREQIDIRAKNLSTHPALLQEAASISVQSRQRLYGLDLTLDAGARAASTHLYRKQLAVDELMVRLKGSASPPLSGGAMDIELRGQVQLQSGLGVWLDLPLHVTLHKTTLRLPGTRPTPVDRLDLPLGIRGPLASPRIHLEDKALADALVAAGKAELASQVRKLAGDKLPGAEKAGDLLKDRGKAVEAAGKKAEEELKKRLPGGIFGGKKDKRDKDRK